jgi:hypothetical protein
MFVKIKMLQLFIDYIVYSFYLPITCTHTNKNMAIKNLVDENAQQRVR